jgi:hypothetical protein
LRPFDKSKQWLAAKFPTQRNREFLRDIRENSRPNREFAQRLVVSK